MIHGQWSMFNGQLIKRYARETPPLDVIANIKIYN